MFIIKNLHHEKVPSQYFSFSCQPGESLAIVGPSGCGKTTLLSMLGLVLKPTSGTYSLLGHDLLNVSPNEQAWYRSNRIASIFQQHHLIPHFTAQENIDLALGYQTPQKTPSDVSELLNEFGIDTLSNHQTHTLSVGEKQRLAIARALIMQPQLLLADEPTSSLDKKHGIKALELIHSWCRKHNTILIMATHDPTAVESCGRTYEWSST